MKNYTKDTLARIEEETEELSNMTSAELKAHEKYEKKFTKLESNVLKKEDTILTDPEGYKRQLALEKMFAPFKKAIELEKTWKEPISFADATKHAYWLDQTLEMLDLKQAA